MNESRFVRLRDWVEPAHPGVIQLHDDLLAIVSRFREKYQAQIDEVFDGVAKQIGFVVATTLPVTLEVGEKGRVAAIGLKAEHLKGTIFEEGFAPVFKAMAEPLPSPAPSPGTYAFPLLWLNALKVRLRTDWMEPVHHPAHLRCKEWEWVPPPSRDWLEPAHPPLPWQRRCVRWGLEEWPHWLDWVEPAHFLDPEASFKPSPDPWRERVVISVIDQVYPELRLIERIAAGRQLQGPVMPDVKEPAHFRELGRFSPEVLAELAAVLKKHGY